MGIRDYDTRETPGSGIPSPKEWPIELADELSRGVSKMHKSVELALDRVNTFPE